MTPVATFLQDPDLIRILYIVAFICFILGLRLLNHPRTAKRGNAVAAVGMAIAVVATLLWDFVGDYWLIAVGIAIGTAVGIPAARSVKMTAMPQMVALFNGVGGGAVALIAWSEFRTSNGDLTELAILVLAAFVGFEVISKVPNTLHTPLMSGTNAIHGIVLLGALLVIGPSEGFLDELLLVVAIAFGTINIVGGFLVTDRMLEMFKGKSPKQVKAGAEDGG